MSLYFQSLEPLVKTMADLCGDSTVVYCCYEERTTGNKPELQRKFMQVSFVSQNYMQTFESHLHFFISLNQLLIWRE